MYDFEAVYHMLKMAAEADAQGDSVANTTFGRAASVMQSELQAMDTNKFSRAALHASSGHIPKSQRPKYSEKKEGVEPELDKLLQKYPEISVGSSCDAFEFYDPTGSIEKFFVILKDGSMEKFMPKGSSGAIHGMVDSEAWKEAGHEKDSLVVGVLKAF